MVRQKVQQEEASRRGVVSDTFIIYDMSQTIHSLIAESNKDKYIPAKSYELFDDGDGECYGADPNKHHNVTQESIENYIWLIYSSTKMELECLIPAIIYVQKLLNVQPPRYLPMRILRLYSKNWKTVVGMSMMIACKVWDDFNMDNASFHTIIYCMDLKRCNKLELIFLKMIDFNVAIKGIEYSACEEQIMCNRRKLLQEEPASLLCHSNIR
jgi:hypothetical protein